MATTSNFTLAAAQTRSGMVPVTAGIREAALRWSASRKSRDFVARFRPGRFPGRTARQMSNPTIDYSVGFFPHR